MSQNDTFLDSPARFTKTGEAVCRIINAEGREAIPSRKIKAGEATVNFDISVLADGFYLFVYESSEGVSSRKFLKK